MTDSVLVIEDEAALANLVKVNLSDLHLQVDICDNGKTGLQQGLEKDYALILLDIMLPDIDGLEVCRQLRVHKPAQPIMMLTSLNSETDRVVGLEMGADDYLTKPFSVRELQARVKTQLRRHRIFQDSQAANSQDALEHLQFQGLDIYPDERRAVVDGQELSLTSTEFDLLHYLAKHPERVFSRLQLLDSVWGYKHEGYEHTVNSHINRLRAKVEPDPAQPRYIQTVWGVGYKFSVNIAA